MKLQQLLNKVIPVTNQRVMGHLYFGCPEFVKFRSLSSVQDVVTTMYHDRTFRLAWEQGYQYVHMRINPEGYIAY